MTSHDLRAAEQMVTAIRGIIEDGDGVNIMLPWDDAVPVTTIDLDEAGVIYISRPAKPDAKPDMTFRADQLLGFVSHMRNAHLPLNISLPG